ncbi:MAG: uracil-DNA glycosylase [Saprospiraceae bacterium]|nr:uracil-DNA glycosylase [Saprospiraceae bacterium]
MAELKKVDIDASWYKLLKEEFEAAYFSQIKSFLVEEMNHGKTIFPPGKKIFNAFDSTPVDKVKVVILGQDPYHNYGEAMGLCFSVPKGIRVPPSLKNIFKEIQRDLGIPPPDHGDLSFWASQGVFLLNAMLTVEQKKAGSHKKIGWQEFTDAVIKKLSDEKEGLVFLLWGNFARSKKDLIDEMKHYVLEARHPSPLAGGAFSGCGHFSKANELLESQGKTPIVWELL